MGKTEVFIELRKNLVYEVYSHFSKFAGSDYAASILAPVLAEDMLKVIRKKAFVYHTGEKDELKIVYGGYTYEFTPLLKELTHLALSVMQIVKGNESKFIKEVVYIVRVNSFVLYDTIKHLERYILTKNYKVFDRVTGEFLPWNRDTFFRFYNMFESLGYNPQLSKFAELLEKEGDGGDLEGKFIDNISCDEMFKLLFSLIPFPIKINASYNPDAKAPRWEQFLKEIVNEKYIVVLKRYAGYLLFPDLPYHKVLVLTGSGSNGKSTFLNILEEVLGKENVGSMPVQSLSSRFAISALEHKLVNIYPDLPAYAFKDTGVFKALTGGDYVPIERKYKDVRFGILPVKHIFSANKLPSTKDKTYAFYRRWLIINFPNQFEGDKADPHLKDKLKKEIDGIFLWMLEGYRELKETGDFGYIHTIEEIMDMYELGSDTLKQFVFAHCDEGSPEDWITKDEFYALYKAYCEEHNLPPVSKVYVSKHLKEYLSTVDASIKKVNGVATRIWTGIRVDYTPQKESKNSDVVTVRVLEPFRIATPEGELEAQKEDVLTVDAKIADILEKSGKVEVVRREY